MSANQKLVDWKPYHGKEHLVYENLFNSKPTQSPQSIIVDLIVNYELKNTRFYLNSAAKVYMYYDRLLFSIYKEKNSPPLYTADDIDFNVLGKSIVTLDVLIDGK